MTLENPAPNPPPEAATVPDNFVTRCSCGGEKRVIHSKDYGDYVRQERECDRCGRRFEDRNRQTRELPRRGKCKTRDCAYQPAEA